MITKHVILCGEEVYSVVLQITVTHCCWAVGWELFINVMFAL